MVLGVAIFAMDKANLCALLQFDSLGLQTEWMNVMSTRKFTEVVLVKHQMYMMSTASTPEKIHDLSLRSFFGQRILWCGTTRQEKGREHWGKDGGLRGLSQKSSSFSWTSYSQTTLSHPHPRHFSFMFAQNRYCQTRKVSFYAFNLHDQNKVCQMTWQYSRKLATGFGRVMVKVSNLPIF